MCADERQKLSPIKEGTDSTGVDICIGWRGLKKMGLGIDPVTHKVVVAQPRQKAGGWRFVPTTKRLQEKDSAFVLQMGLICGDISLMTSAA